MARSPSVILATMKRGLEALFEAIIANDRRSVSKFLTDDPLLAKAAVETPRLYPQLHWIYAGDTALHGAAAGHRVDLVELLLEAGADPRAARNHRRSQPLHYAADGNPQSCAWSAERQVETIRLLLKGGADCNAGDANGATALHRAVRTRCAAAVKFLLESGADPTRRNKPGSTPFHLAVQNTGRGGSGAEEAKTAQRDIIQLFLQYGLKPTLRDARGRSVSEWAKSAWIREKLGL